MAPAPSDHIVVGSPAVGRIVVGRPAVDKLAAELLSVALACVHCLLD